MEMAKNASAIAYMLDARIEEKPFRSSMVKMGMEHGRICMMPGLTQDMMARLVNIDFKQMDLFTHKVIKALKDADDVLGDLVQLRERPEDSRGDEQQGNDEPRSEQAPEDERGVYEKIVE